MVLCAEKNCQPLPRARGRRGPHHPPFLSMGSAKWGSKIAGLRPPAVADPDGRRDKGKVIADQQGG